MAIAQERALHAISSDLARIFSDLKLRGATPADAAGLQPVVDVLKAYAGAAGVSHFASQTTAALAGARQLAALLPLALAEDRIRQTRELVRDQQATQLDAGRVEEGSRDPIASLPLLSERAAQLRAQAVRGESVAPGSIARLGVDADEMSLRSRLITLTSQVRTVELRAREAGVPDERVGSDGFWTVQGVVSLLRSNIRSWTEALDKAKRWTGPVDGQTSEQAATEQLRTAISTVEQRMVGFDDKLKIGEFLNWAYEQIADKQLRDAIAKIAIEIGVMIVTGQVASAGIATLRGFSLAREAMLAGEIIGEARSAGLGFAALEIATQAGMGTVTHGAMGGKMGPREFAENAVGIGFANIAMRPFAKLFKDASKAEAEIRTFAQLAKRSGKMVVRGGVELGVNVGVSAAAHYVTHFDHLEIASSDTWITQGFALLAGRFVHQRTTGMHQRIEHAAKASGTRAFDALKKRVAALEARAAASTATTSPEKATHLLEESHALLVEERVIHERLANEGHADEVGAKAVERDLDAVGPEFVEVPLRLAGLKSVVDGEIYAGTGKQIRDAIESAERMGIKVEQTFDPARTVRKLRVGDREIVVHEEFPTPKTTREWADELADSNPTKMSPEEIKADTAAYGERKATVDRMYEEAMAGERPTPSGVSKERLQLAVKGDPRTGERIPLTYGSDPVEAKRLFDQFRGELQEVFNSEGVTDAVVVQLGSGSTGWSSAPGKTGKAWTPTSDVDFAIFSDQALAQAKSVNAPVNPKNQQSGKYTTIWNEPKTGAPGFHATALGEKLAKLSIRWNKIVFGDADAEGFDFKLNLGSEPFVFAVPVIRPKGPSHGGKQ